MPVEVDPRLEAIVSLEPKILKLEISESGASAEKEKGEEMEKSWRITQSSAEIVQQSEEATGAEVKSCEDWCYGF